jgi:hypothetical protein
MAQEKQYLGVVSFDSASIRDTATITAASLPLRRGTAIGNPNIPAFGALVVDVAPVVFGGSSALQMLDFADAPANLAAAAATMTHPANNGDASTGVLGSAGLAAINLVGLTQTRVRRLASLRTEVVARCGVASVPLVPTSATALRCAV